MLDQLRQRKHEPVTYQTVQAREDGSTYPVEVNLQLITAEYGGERILAIVHDITALQTGRGKHPEIQCAG